MNNNLENRLRKNFPKLLGQVPVRCDDGWYKLVHDLCLKLDNINDLKIESIVSGFGCLRVDTNPPKNFEAETYIRTIQNISFQVCEECGSREKVAGRFNVERPGLPKYWLKTLCYKCAYYTRGCESSCSDNL